jgi:hypothetical protein
MDIWDVELTNRIKALKEFKRRNDLIETSRYLVVFLPKTCEVVDLNEDGHVVIRGNDFPNCHTEDEVEIIIQSLSILKPLEYRIVDIQRYLSERIADYESILN